MIAADIPKNEDSRLNELESYHILDTPNEPEFDFITKLASQICGTSIALISFVDKDRQWFKSKIGLELEETERYVSFCAHAILNPNEVMKVEDTASDERFSSNPLVVGEPNIKFYLGVPLVSANGFALGTLCTIDSKPRKIFDNQIESLKLLANQVVALLELKKAKKNLTKEKTKLELMLENSSDLVLITNLETNETQFSESWKKLLPSSLSEMNFNSLKHIIHLDDLEKTLDWINLEGYKSQNLFNKIQIENGDVVYLDWSAFKHDTLLFLTARNVTSRIEKEMEIEKLNRLLEDAQKMAKLGAWELDLVSNKTTWTSEVYEIHEVDHDFDHNLNNGIDFYHPLDREMVRNSIQKTIETKETFEFICRFITAKNNLKWVRCSGRFFEDLKGDKKLYGIFQDITQEKVYELKLLQEKEITQNIIEGANVGTWQWNVENGETVFDEKWCEMLGYKPEELKPFSIKTWSDSVHPDDLENAIQKLNEAFEKKTVYYSAEFRMKHKNGSWLWVSGRGKVFSWTEKGKPLMMYGTNQDITEKKNNELTLFNQLETIKLQNEKLHNFAHIVSHNLRTHSGNISTLLDIIQEQYPELSKDQVFEFIKQASFSLGETIDYLSEVAKLHTSNANLDEKVELGLVVKHAISNTIALAGKSNVEINNQIKSNIFVMGDRVYLDSIVLNLITNSIKYCSPDRDSYVLLECVETENIVQLIVKDNGIGIDLKKNGHKLFGMFKTFHAHPDARGVGLFITKNQVEAMGGKIEVESEIGVGTTFKITFKKWAA